MKDGAFALGTFEPNKTAASVNNARNVGHFAASY
jgi:hypothetical protein